MTSKKPSRKSIVDATPNTETFRLLFHNHPIPMWVYDLKTLAFLDVNDAAVEKYGYTREEFLALTIKDIHSPEDVARLLKDVKQKRSPLQYSGQWRHRLKDGRVIDVEITSHTIEFNGRQAALAMQNARLYEAAQKEITERKQAEESLRESEERYRDLVENIQDLVCTHDLEGNILFVNQAPAKLLGYAPNELVGRNLRDLLPPKVRDQFDIYLSFIQRDGIASGLMRVLTKNGDERLWEYNNSLRIEGVDAPIVRGMAHDVTERKRAEEALQASQANLSLVFNNTSDMQVLFEVEKNKKLRILAVNRSYIEALRLLGFSPSTANSFTGLHRDEMLLQLGFPKEGIEADEQHYLRAIESGSVVKYEQTVPSPTTTLVIESSIVPVVNNEGRCTHLLYSARDITEHKQAEDEIRQRVTELEMLYEIGLAFSRLSSPKEIGQKIIELLDQKMNWHHTTIRQYHPENETLELLAFNQPGLSSEQEKRAVEGRFRTIIAKKGQGLSGWVIEHGQGVRTSDLINDARYIDTYPGLCSGLYVPIKSGERIIGVISIESEKENAFSAADERLTTILANQAASALENARLFEQERIRTFELSTLYEATKTISSDLALESVLETVAEKMAQVLRSDGCTLSLLNRERDALVTLVDYRTKHPDRAESKDMIYYLNAYPASRRVLELGQPLAIDPMDKEADQSELAHMKKRGLAALLMLPLVVHDQAIGLVEIYEEERTRAYKQEEIQLLQSLASQAAISIENARLFEDAQRRLRQTKALREIDQAITGSMDMQHVLKIVLKHTISELGVDAAVILLYDPTEQSLYYELGSGFRANSLQFTRLRLGEGYAGRAALGKQTIYIPDLQVRNTDFLRSPTFHQEGFICYFGIPLIAKGKIMGVLEIFHRAALNPDIEWLGFMETLAGQIAIAIDNATLFEDLQRSNVELSQAYDATIEGWSRALDLRDKETEGHTLRVTELTRQMAQEMGMSEEALVHIRRGALLHDIGKMGVPDRILLKPDTLTDEEWKIMHKHPIFAYEMLSPIGFLLPALDIPYCHHEKWNGTGYPRKLKGDEIPLVARIFAVVDVWDALTSNRPYRPAWTKEQALEHIQEQSGKHFDPNVVKVFLRLIAEE